MLWHTSGTQAPPLPFFQKVSPHCHPVNNMFYVHCQKWAVAFSLCVHPNFCLKDNSHSSWNRTNKQQTRPHVILGPCEMQRLTEHLTCHRHLSTWRTGCLKIDYVMRRIQTRGRRLTHWYEWLRGRTVARHADAVDGVDSHLVRHPFDHPLGFIGGVRVRVKVQPHPPVALRLLSLQHVTWEARHEEAMQLLSNKPVQRRRLLVLLLFTDNWLSTVKLRRLPLDNTGVLPHTQDFNCLWRIWDIWWCGGG